MSGTLVSDRLMNSVEMKGNLRVSGMQLANVVLNDDGETQVNLSMADAGSLLEIEPRAGAALANLVFVDAQIGSQLYIHNRDDLTVTIKANSTSGGSAAIATTEVVQVVFVSDGGDPAAPTPVIVAKA